MNKRWDYKYESSHLYTPQQEHHKIALINRKASYGKEFHVPECKLNVQTKGRSIDAQTSLVQVIKGVMDVSLKIV